MLERTKQNKTAITITNTIRKRHSTVSTSTPTAVVVVAAAQKVINFEINWTISEKYLILTNAFNVVFFFQLLLDFVGIYVLLVGNETEIAGN